MKLATLRRDPLPRNSHVLIVDDEETICWGLERLLSEEGHRVSVASSAEDALASVEREAPDLVVMDVRLPGMDGISAIERLHVMAGPIPVVVITAFGSLDIAVAAMKQGAIDYLTKPFDLDQAAGVIRRALEHSDASCAPIAGEELEAGTLLGACPAMQLVFKQIALVAPSDASVMIITTYRSDELTRRHPLRPFLAEVGRFPGTERIDLPNLERAEVAELLTQLMERPPSNVVIDLVYKRSEGIPYFVEELTRSAARGCIDMPDTLRDALNVRVLSLSDRTQQTLQLAAVAGNRVDHGLLEAVADASDGELESQLREAIDAAVLTTDETGYNFRHALLREVVHDDLLPGQHARLHARFAAILEEHPELMSADTAPSEIAHHWNAAHQVNKAFRWALTAAESGSAAFHEALKLYERALELWDQVDDPESLVSEAARWAWKAERPGMHIERR
jgi:DNA-binding response OmpR family regulator